VRVVVTGATGLIGSALLPSLTASGHDVRRVVRGAPRQSGDVGWDPSRGRLDPADLADVEAVVHLAGESIAGLWTGARRDRIYHSRIDGTRLLVRALASAPAPRVLVCASAIGFYGSRGNESLTEESPPGTGFLAKLCQDWEAEAESAAQSGARVVSSRFGVIQSPAGGMLKAMRLSARVGPVVRLGRGREHLSWVALDDVVRAILFSLDTAGVIGPVNVVAPNPSTNAAYARLLGRLLHRPVLRVPALAARVALAGVADELLLQSARVMPQRLVAQGFSFQQPTLERALRAALNLR
jgi:uncharacterized protein